MFDIMKMFLTFMLMLISLIMIFLNHPLSMGLMILLQSLLICLLSGMMIKTYWFSYILFLTFMGGLLVLFIYVSSIASNEMFISFSLKLKLIILITSLMLTMFMLYYKYNLKWMNLNFNSDMINFYNLNLLINNENKINLTKLYNNQTFFLMLMLIIYLFITLVTVIKITNILFGPLRMSNN